MHRWQQHRWQTNQKQWQRRRLQRHQHWMLEQQWKKQLDRVRGEAERTRITRLPAAGMVEAPAAFDA